MGPATLRNSFGMLLGAVAIVSLESCAAKTTQIDLTPAIEEVSGRVSALEQEHAMLRERSREQASRLSDLEAEADHLRTELQTERSRSSEERQVLAEQLEESAAEIQAGKEEVERLRARADEIAGDLAVQSGMISSASVGEQRAMAMFNAARTESAAIRDALTDVQNEVDRLRVDQVSTPPMANLAYNHPDSMVRDETTVVQLILHPDKSIDELKSLLTEKGSRKGGEVRLSQIIEAELSGEPGFTIDPEGPQEQAVYPGERTEWSWTVTAVKEGAQMLTVTVRSVVDYGGRETRKNVQLRDVVLVRVTPRQRIAGFVGGNWQWLWTAVLVPIGLWLWKRYQKGARGGA